jgi:hypothetical protein
MSQSVLAEAAHVHLNTVKAAEGVGNKQATLVQSLVACQQALEEKGVEFLEIGGRLGVVYPGRQLQDRGARLRAIRETLAVDRFLIATLVKFGERSILNAENGDPGRRGGNIAALEGLYQELGFDLFDLDDRPALLLPNSEDFKRATDDLSRLTAGRKR